MEELKVIALTSCIICDGDIPIYDMMYAAKDKMICSECKRRLKELLYGERSEHVDRT